jgi:hypothetical protein
MKLFLFWLIPACFALQLSFIGGIYASYLVQGSKAMGFWTYLYISYLE